MKEKKNYRRKRNVYYYNEAFGKVTYYDSKSWLTRKVTMAEKWMLENGYDFIDMVTALDITQHQFHEMFALYPLDLINLRHLIKLSELCNKPVGDVFEAIQDTQTFVELKPHEVKMYLRRNDVNLKKATW